MISVHRPPQPAGSPIGIIAVALSALVGVVACDESLDESVLLGAGSPATDPAAGAGAVTQSQVRSAPLPKDAVVVDVDRHISHLVVPGDTLASIAERYGVGPQTIDLALARGALRPSTCLEARAAAEGDPDTGGVRVSIREPRRRPLAKQCVLHEITRASDWPTLAERFRVDAGSLRTHNGDLLGPAVGQVVQVWIDPSPVMPLATAATLSDPLGFHRGESIGNPDAGSIEEAVQLPPHVAYTRAPPELMWGSRFTIMQLRVAIVGLREEFGGIGEIAVGPISSRQGGPMAPHRSHQSGLDVDIALPLLHGVKRPAVSVIGAPGVGASEVDWYASWALVRSLMKTRYVRRIYVDFAVRSNLYAAARDSGATPWQLEAVFGAPGTDGSASATVRHFAGLRTLIHVRFACAPWDRSCDESTVGPDAP